MTHKASAGAEPRGRLRTIVVLHRKRGLLDLVNKRVIHPQPCACKLPPEFKVLGPIDGVVRIPPEVGT